MTLSNSVKASYQIPVDRDKVRMMVADFGYKETAQRLQLKESRIRQWAHRGKWFKPVDIHAQSKSVTTVIKPIADAHSEALRELESKTRLNLARYAAKASGEAKGRLKEAPLMHKTAQIAGITHQWGASQNSGNNILNLAVLTGATPSKPVEHIVDKVIDLSPS